MPASTPRKMYVGMARDYYSVRWLEQCLGLIVQVCRVDLGCMMSSDVRFYVSGVLCYMVP